MVGRMLENVSSQVLNEEAIITTSHTSDSVSYITTCNDMDCVDKFLIATSHSIFGALVPPRSGQPG
jgi:hypothetical protein